MSTNSPQAVHTPPLAPLADVIARIAAVHAGYTLPAQLPESPFDLFQQWFDDELKSRRQPNPNCMTLASIDPDGTPSARVVLCRGTQREKGFITFFTNYTGRKGRAVMANPRVCANFHWDHTDRQARIEGYAVRSPARESDDYFASRRWESRLSAWASDQSRPIESREALLAKVPQVLAKLGLTAEIVLAQQNNLVIPRPPHWGGFRLYVTRLELWIGGPGRLHDRGVWTRDLPMPPADGGRPEETSSIWESLDASAARASAWRSTRMQP
jgi:pyridoxamine 5'-phosphate oxidase